MSTVTVSHCHAVCPHCKKPDGVVDQLLGQETWTRWYCDHCGGAYSLSFTGEGGVTIAPLPDRCIRTIDLLVLPPQEKPIYFVVQGMRFSDDTRPVYDAKGFYYEEHSCPTNWLQPELMVQDGDPDPHGVLQYITTRDVTGKNQSQEFLEDWALREIRRYQK